MQSRHEPLARRALVLAVQSALITLFGAPMAASAQDVDVRTLTEPTNVVEIGLLGVTNADANPKFGEYNGLYRSGAFGIANFDLRGGDAYGMGSGTRRWSVYGSDLG